MFGWTEDWQGQFRSLVQEMGYKDTYDYAMSKPCESFGKLFNHIRQFSKAQYCISPCFHQMEMMFYIDAMQMGQLRNALINAFIRGMVQYFKSGWNCGKKIRERRCDVQSSWPTPYWGPGHTKYSFDEWYAIQKQVWLALEEINPPASWCPRGTKDIIIQLVFDRILPSWED